jgi:para-aminobenzoate synthetase component 1
MGRRLPLIEELKTSLSPLTLFQLFRSEPFCFFLDSGMDPQKLGRYSFMGASPFLVLKSFADRITLARGDSETIIEGNPFDILERYLEIYRLDCPEAAVPFTGGAVGYFSYDLCHFLEKLPATARSDLNFPECYFGFYDRVLAYDNLLGKAFIVSTGFPQLDEKARLARARESLEDFKNRLSRSSVSSLTVPDTIDDNREIGRAHV